MPIISVYFPLFAQQITPAPYNSSLTSVSYFVYFRALTLEPLLQEVAFVLQLPKVPLPCLSFSSLAPVDSGAG